jgi:hypothetical protein
MTYLDTDRNGVITYATELLHFFIAGSLLLATTTLLDWLAAWTAERVAMKLAAERSIIIACF